MSNRPLEKNTENTSPTVSVVITCYNYGHYLDGCIQSVLQQTYTDYEILLIDDGSTDNTAEVVQKYSHLKNFHYIFQENGGQARAKNRGIESARGEFIAFLDADDLWHQDKLAEQMPLFADPGVGVVYSRAQLIDANGEKMEVGDAGEYLRPRSGRVVEWLLFDNFVWFSSSVLRATCLQQFGRFDESLAMGIDWDLWMRLSLHCDFAYVDRPLLLYRAGHPGQMSKNADGRRACADRILDGFINAHKERLHPRAVRQAQAYADCNRGYHYIDTDRWRSLCFFARSVCMHPWSLEPYKGLVRWLFRF